MTRHQRTEDGKRAPLHAVRLGLRRIRTIALCATLPLTLSAALRTAEPQGAKRVLVLYWFSQQHPIVVEIERGLHSELGSARDLPIAYFAEYLDTDRFPGARQNDLVRDYLRRKYAGQPIDVVVAAGAGAVAFFERDTTLFRNVPHVLIGTVRTSSPMRQAATVSFYRAFRKQLDLVRRLHPETQHAFIVSGTLQRDRVYEMAARADLDGYAHGISVTYLTDLQLDQLVARARALPPRSIILFVWQQARGAGDRILQPADILAAVTPAATAPVYGMTSAMVGDGIVGGDVFAHEENGRQAARLALRILNGERPEDIPVERATSVPMFDSRALRRWRVPEDRLPEGSIVLFRERSAWDHYKWYIIAAIAVCALQGGLIAALLVQRSMRRRAERTALAQQRELTHLSRLATLGELTGELTHEIGQPLTAIVLNAQAAQRRFAGKQGELKEILDDIAEAAAQTFAVMSSIRQLMHKTDGARSVLDVNGVVADTMQLVAGELEFRGVAVTTTLAPVLPAVIGNRAELQQVLLNLVLNACDAMNEVTPESRQLTLRTQTLSAGVRITVADQGHGIRPESRDVLFTPFFTTKENGLGLGLAICQRIISAHQGHVWAENNVGAGATFHVQLPLATSVATDLTAAVPPSAPAIPARYPAVPTPVATSTPSR